MLFKIAERWTLETHLELRHLPKGGCYRFQLREGAKESQLSAHYQNVSKNGKHVKIVIHAILK